MTLPELTRLYPTDEKCREILTKLRWPEGVECRRARGAVCRPRRADRRHFPQHREAHPARPLDLQRLRLCASLFLGEHDWTAFSAAQSDAESRVRKVLELHIEDGWDGRGLCHLISFRVTANGFLRYMVRSIVGTLLEIGRAEMDEPTVERALSSGNRVLAGDTAPAKGLTLTHVSYSDRAGIGGPRGEENRLSSQEMLP